MPRILYLDEYVNTDQRPHIPRRTDRPPEEVETLADEQECLLAGEERLAGARNVLVRGVPVNGSAFPY